MPESRERHADTSHGGYLEASTNIEERLRPRGNRLALQSAGSVTNMVQKLAVAKPPFFKYERHYGVCLSRAGRKRALEIIRYHRLIETFLYEVLNYPLDELHDEAERLEHFISESFEKRIATKLGNPQLDPHGHCIPSLDGSMPAIHRVTCKCE